MTTNVPFVNGVATCGGVGTGWVWNVKVQVPNGVSSQTFTVKIAGTTVATLTGSETYGPVALVGTDTMTVTASGGSAGQSVTLTGDVQPYTVPVNPNFQNLIAPLELPAESGKPLTTQGGNTLDDGNGDLAIVGTLRVPGQVGVGSSAAPGFNFSSFGAGTIADLGGNIGIALLGNGLGVVFNSGGNNIFANNGVAVAALNSDGSVQPNMAAKIHGGTGAPTIAGTAGDFFFRTDTPTTTNQRIYICTVSGAAGAATWVGIV